MAQRPRRRRQQRRRSYQPQQRRRQQQRRQPRGPQQRRSRRRDQGSSMAYLVSMAGSLAASDTTLGWGASLAVGAYASNSSDGQLRSVGNGLLVGAGLYLARAVWRDRKQLLEAIGLA